MGYFWRRAAGAGWRDGEKWKGKEGREGMKVGQKVS